MDYDLADKKIIEALYHDWRTSSSELSRKTRLSRRQVDYRIKGYFSSGVIRSLFTVPNYVKLGYEKLAYAFIRLKNKKSWAEVGKYLDNRGRCTSWGRAWTEYDLFVNLIFRNKTEMYLFFKGLRNSFKKEIDKIEIIEPSHAEFFPLKQVGNNLEESYLLTDKDTESAEIDDLGIRIIKEIARDARKPVVEIARKLRISPERCLYRLRKLFKERILLGSRIQFGLEKAGYSATCLFIETGLSDKTIESLRGFCKKNESVNYLIVSEKNPRVIIQVFHKEKDVLRKVIQEVGILLADRYFNISLVELEDDFNVINSVPFLD